MPMFIRGTSLPAPCVLAVGKFESIHLGHQQLINTVVTQAKAQNLASAMVIFDPHPYRLLGRPAYKPLLTDAERALVLAEQCPRVDYVLSYPFDAALMALSAEQFADMLFNDLQAREVIVGEGYRFGHGRTGTIEMLSARAAAHGASVTVLPPQKQDADTISTSGIRVHLDAGRLHEAAQQLGYPFFAGGIVTQGRRLGRELGFPTANLYPQEDKYLPADGVYATRTHIDGHGIPHPSITNVGLRPTVQNPAGTSHRTIETHLFHHPAYELYGETIRVEFLHFIRPERKFDSLDALREQITIDIASASSPSTK